MTGTNAAPGGPTTIVAPATPPGRGAVAILRLSGPGAHPIASRLTGIDPGTVPPRALVRCTVRDASGSPLDAGLVVLFRAPASFTGEDVAELHLHGNTLLIERAMREACALGAVPAAPGEFSRRAYENGKMDLTQAEGLSDLIAARTEGAVKAALRQSTGELKEAIAGVRAELVSLLTLLEASIDFSDEEDAAFLHDAELAERVSNIDNRLEGFARSYDRGRRYRDGAFVAIAGVTNVGKSRLLNRIVGEERAIVTDVPGTTRDYLTAEVDLFGVPVRFVDTAGLRETGDPVEREGVRRSRRIISEADMILFLLDGSRPAGAEDREAYAELADRPHVLVLNKSDLPAAESGEGFDGRGRKGVLAVSARTGEGLERLLAVLASEWRTGAGDMMAEVPLTRVRHVYAVHRAREALARASGAVADRLPAECVAEDVREAARSLSELLGEIAPEELLDGIFSAFCIGK